MRLESTEKIFALSVLLSADDEEERWDTVRFSTKSDLHHTGRFFLQRAGVKSVFRQGLVREMHAMIAHDKLVQCVDLADLAL